MEILNDNTILSWIESSDKVLNNQAFRNIYENNFNLIQKLIEKNSGTLIECQDIFQDAIVVLYNNVKKGDFKLSCSLQTYMYSVCKKMWLKKLRKRGRSVQLNTDLHENIELDNNHLDCLLATEKTKRIASLLDSMSEDYKKILFLFYFDKMRMNEIATQMGYANEQVAKNKKSRAIKKLKELVKIHNINKEEI